MEQKNTTKTQLNDLTSKSLNGWIPRKEIQAFLNLKATAICEFHRKHNISISKIGRTVYYRLEDIIQLLNNNVITP